MTPRQATDAYLTTPCAAIALGGHLAEHHPGLVDGGAPVLDPFAGAGTLVPWTLGDLLAGRVGHAFELERRWRPELYRHLHPARVRFCDSLSCSWLVAGGRVAPAVLTNPPFVAMDQAIARLYEHARTHRVLVAALTRTDWWQHPGRRGAGDERTVREDFRPDTILMLRWRPAFGFRRDRATGKLLLGTDRFTGYVWAIWEPEPREHTRLLWATKPAVPRALKGEHKRLALMAYEFTEAA